MTRFGYVMTTYFTVILIGGLSFIHITPRLIWNASASTPVGLYSIDRSPQLEVKRVAGLSGQQVCRTGAHVTVDGIPVGDALPRDRLGRHLPVWQGCRRIAADEIFLMNWSVEDSLDGRYFGPVSRGSVIGRATPLYTDEDGNGRFEWRAATR